MSASSAEDLEGARELLGYLHSKKDKGLATALLESKERQRATPANPVSLSDAANAAEVLLSSLSSEDRKRGLHATLKLVNEAAARLPELPHVEAFAIEAVELSGSAAASVKQQDWLTPARAFALLTLFFINRREETEALRAAYWMRMFHGWLQLDRSRRARMRGLSDRRAARQRTKEFARALFASGSWKSKADFARRNEKQIRDHAERLGWRMSSERFVATVRDWLR